MPGRSGVKDRQRGGGDHLDQSRQRRSRRKGIPNEVGAARYTFEEVEKANGFHV